MDNGQCEWSAAQKRRCARTRVPVAHLEREDGGGQRNHDGIRDEMPPYFTQMPGTATFSNR